jgi:hypothetical protein
MQAVSGGGVPVESAEVESDVVVGPAVVLEVEALLVDVMPLVVVAPVLVPIVAPPVPLPSPCTVSSDGHANASTRVASSQA